MHTPGPWTISPCHDGDLSVGNFGPGNYLESARCIDMENARLIAAAPDLLEALKACELLLSAAWESTLPELKQARAALAKVGG